MSRQAVLNKSRVICRKLLEELQPGAIKTLSVYRPLDDLNEVDTSFFVDIIQSQHPEVEIKFMGSSKNETMPTQKFDLIIVPALAFDRDNYRLGWGGGFYDKFLARQPQSLKIGLCFQNGFIEEGFQHESYDIPLDKIITEV
jgi:5-formyltetrahydrofolate cyclo-ligase